jgi:hypothetical protein
MRQKRTHEGGFYRKGGEEDFSDDTQNGLSLGKGGNKDGDESGQKDVKADFLKIRGCRGWRNSAWAE